MKIIIFSQRLDIFDRTAQPMCVSMVKPSQEDELFRTVMKYFFEDSCSFPYIKTLLKVSEPVFEKILNESTTLMCKIYSAVLF